MRTVKSDESFEYATLEIVKRRLEQKGLKQPSQPEEELPDTPTQLADLPPGEVINLFRLYEAHYEHVNYSHAIAELLVGEWKNNLKHILASVKQDQPDGDIELNELIISARKRLQIHEQEAVLLGTHKSALHRRMALVSRAIEGLKLSFSGSIRGENAGRAWD